MYEIIMECVKNCIMLVLLYRILCLFRFVTAESCAHITLSMLSYLLHFKIENSVFSAEKWNAFNWSIMCQMFVLE